MHSLRLLLHPQTPEQSLLHVIARHSSAVSPCVVDCRVVVVLLPTLASVPLEVMPHPGPRSTSLAVVVPPKMHKSLLLLHPHGNVQKLLHKMDPQSNAVVGAAVVGAKSPHPGPRLASDDDVVPPRMHMFFELLHPHESTQSLLQVMEVQSNAFVADDSVVVWLAAHPGPSSSSAATVLPPSTQRF